MCIGNINPMKMKNMKSQNIVFQKFRFISILLLCILFTGVAHAQKNTDKKEKNKAFSVSLNVVDENNNPIPEAQVVVGEGIVHTTTDAQGALSFQAFLTDVVTITSHAYEKEVTTVSQLITNKTVKLKKAKLFMTTDDNVPLPFTTIGKRQITGSENVILGDQLEKYPSTDLRNAFTGLATGLEVVEKYGITGTSAEEKLGNFGATEKSQYVPKRTKPYFYHR